MRFLIGIALTFAFAVGSGAAQDTQPRLDLNGGWQEAVIVVPDAERAADFYRTVAGWTVRSSDEVDPSHINAWGLPEHASARQIVVGNLGDDTGFVRLVQFSGVEQDQIRPSGRSWEPGGHSGINMRVHDIDAKYRAFQEWGWHGYSQPVRFDLDRFTVREVMMQGFGGELIAMIERVSPPLEGWPTLKELSRAFNAFAAVGDFEAAEAFYKDVLGFSEYLREEGPSAVPGANLFGLPHNWVSNMPRKLVWLHPRGENEGSIAIQQFFEVEGTDFGDRASPPNFGMLMLRYPVSDADARAAEIQSQGWRLEFDPVEVAMPPYGKVRVFAVRDPNGGWLEFFEPIKSAR